MAQTNGLQDAVSTWKALHDNDTIAPEGDGCTIQLFWDENGVRIGLEGLILEATDTKIMARLLDASCHDGGSWLDVFPVATLRNWSLTRYTLLLLRSELISGVIRSYASLDSAWMN